MAPFRAGNEGAVVLLAVLAVLAIVWLAEAGAALPRPSSAGPRAGLGARAGPPRDPASASRAPPIPRAPGPGAEHQGAPASPPEASPKAPPDVSGESYSHYGGADASGMWLSDTPQDHSTYASLSRLYSTADVDPLIAGNLYRFADGVRDIYSQRTCLEGGPQGLTEFSSSALPGDVGVDVGPYGLAKDPATEGADDGIPENWRFPEAPVRWYAPKLRDYYGPEGATPTPTGLFPLSEPDHSPRMP